MEFKERGVAPRHQAITRTQLPLRITDHTLDQNLSSLSLTIQGHSGTPASHDLGNLRSLPVELLHEISGSVDICALTHFRCVNKRAVELVDSLPEYKAIALYAPNALLGILSIRTGQWITCQTLYDKLCTPHCEKCGHFGGHLYLITCRRVCYSCFTEDKDFRPLLPSAACLEFGLDSAMVSNLPRMTVVPGQCTHWCLV
jgi:hypothetical protein